MSGLIDYQDLLRLTTDILLKGYGYNQKEAGITATLLVEADARGIPSHGVSRLAFYRTNLDLGHCRPGSEPEVVWETPVSLVVDARAGVGCRAAEWCVERTMGLARKTGVAHCAVRNSNHYGIAGYWAELMAKNDMIGMAFTNTYIAGVPTFGSRRLLGTNPIAVAVPERDGRIFLLDMATTTVSHGKVELYDRRGKTMPRGWVVDESGEETYDAAGFERTFYQTSFGGHLYLGGVGEDSGGHKGFGLALLIEILCSGLSMGASSLETYPEGGSGGITHYFSATRMDLFGDPGELRDRVGGILETIRRSEKAGGRDRIFIHGEKEAEAREASLRDGVFLDAATKAYLASLADRCGLGKTPGLEG
ncbi:MAG: Ldh family oxidoreductase [Deltaproteobacteria bacterium]|jgi:LDH2 family malate/lactate/ureidoglycolate dehydrogenase|nr:Ldh family oxidoreductase [Deltaproteobacteria bacterium]